MNFGFETCPTCHGTGDDTSGFACMTCDGEGCVCVECGQPPYRCECEEFPSS